MPRLTIATHRKREILDITEQIEKHLAQANGICFVNVLHTTAALTTALALWASISDYENFLDLLGSVFVPLFGVFVVDFFVLHRGRWDLRGRRWAWAMVVPWALGFVAYQLINPGYISWWVTGWAQVSQFIGFRAETWMSASICSFAVAAAATAAVLPVARLRHALAR